MLKDKLTIKTWGSSLYMTNLGLNLDNDKIIPKNTATATFDRNAKVKIADNTNINMTITNSIF